MNAAILKFSLLLKLSQVDWFEVWIAINVFLGGLGCAAAASMYLLDPINAFLHPVCLLMFGWRFSRDVAFNQNSTKDGEYFSLLFTRPITRASYVLTKALVTAVGSFSMVFALLLVYFVGDVLGRAMVGMRPPAFVSGSDILNMMLNAWSFGCLIVLLRVLPQKVGELLFVLSLFAALGTVFSYNLKFEDAGGSVMMQGWEAASTVYHELLFPATDVLAVVEKEPFSYLPIVTYVSNCLLYLVIAMFILNRREFSYAQD